MIDLRDEADCSIDVKFLDWAYLSRDDKDLVPFLLLRRLLRTSKRHALLALDRRVVQRDRYRDVRMLSACAFSVL
jgi:hypothetical protein